MRWWQFSGADVIWCSVILTALYALTGPPTKWFEWLVIPFGLMLGRVAYSLVVWAFRTPIRWRR